MPQPLEYCALWISGKFQNASISESVSKAINANIFGTIQNKIDYTKNRNQKKSILHCISLEMHVQKMKRHTHLQKRKIHRNPTLLKFVRIVVHTAQIVRKLPAPWKEIEGPAPISKLRLETIKNVSIIQCWKESDKLMSNETKASCSPGSRGRADIWPRHVTQDVPSHMAWKKYIVFVIRRFRQDRKIEWA